MSYFIVIRGPGPSWDDSHPLREQAGWAEHAKFMNTLADVGFIRLGGPLGDGSRSLHIVEADRDASIRARLADDPWTSMGILRIVSIEPWEILLGEVPPRWLPRAGSE
jgi:uncharacterized protein YciI